MNIKYLVKDGSGDQYVPIYPFHQETYEQAGGGPGSGSLVNKKLRIAVTINIADESVTYTLLNYNYFAFISEIEIQGERHTFPITGQGPFTWQFDKPGKYTFYITLRPGLPDNIGSPTLIDIRNIITSISLPYGIETLPASIFAGMNMPNVDIVLPSSVKRLNSGQLSGCSLHKLVIPKNCIVNSYGINGCAPEILEFHGTFVDQNIPFCTYGSAYLNLNTSRLKKIVIDCKNTKIGSCNAMSQCEEVEVSGNVDTLYSGCFAGNSNIKKVTLSGNKLKVIQSNAFAGCTKLEDISIADSVEDIQPRCFGGCSSLKYIKLPSSLKVLKSGVFNGNGLSLETVVLPERLEEIQSDAFAGISTLKNVNIPSTITIIPPNCFAATGLQNIDIPNSIITIGGGAFASCSNLKQAEIPNSVLRIESGAFNRSSLTEIIIPTSVKFIGSGAFGECPATKVYIPNTLETVQSGAFSLYNTSYSNNTLTELYVDTNLVAGTNFSSNAQTTNLLFPVIFGNTNYSALKRVELGPHVTRIGDYAFYYSQGSSFVNAREIIFGDSVKEIGSYAFAYATLANELDLSHIERIEDNAFQQFDFKYKDVILHNIKTIENWAFRYAHYINTLEISTEDKTLTESDIDIGYNAFGDCGIYDKLIVDIPVKFDATSFLNPIVLSTGNYSQYKTLYLGDLVYNQIFSPSSYISSPFYIENAYFGKNIEYIPTKMFNNHSNLKIVKLHAKKIGLAAFANCSNLESVEGLDSICYFGNDCFSGCIKLNLGHITVPSVQEGGYIGSGAFNYTKIISLTNNCESVITNRYGATVNCTDLVEVINNAATEGITAQILGYGSTSTNTSLKVVVTNDKGPSGLSSFPALETIVMSNPEVTFVNGDGYVFNNSPKLKDIYIYNKTAPTLPSQTFKDCAENVKVHVPANATGYEAWVDGSTQRYYPYQLHWEIVKDLPAQEDE